MMHAWPCATCRGCSHMLRLLRALRESMRQGVQERVREATRQLWREIAPLEVDIISLIVAHSHVY